MVLHQGRVFGRARRLPRPLFLFNDLRLSWVLHYGLEVDVSDLESISTVGRSPLAGRRGSRVARSNAKDGSIADAGRLRACAVHAGQATGAAAWSLDPTRRHAAPARRRPCPALPGTHRPPAGTRSWTHAPAGQALPVRASPVRGAPGRAGQAQGDGRPQDQRHHAE